MDASADSRRMTVILVPGAQEHLRQLEARTNLSGTDLVNRAITLYEFVDAQLRVGYDIVAADWATGTIQLVQLCEASAGQAPDASPARAGRGWRPIIERLHHIRRSLLPRGRPAVALPLAGLPGQEVRPA